MKHDAENPKAPHFVGKHIRDGIAIASYGPFAFLNPTNQRYAFDLKPKRQDHDKVDSSEEEKNGSSNTNGELKAEHKKELAEKKEKAEEIRAEDVQRLFRTRDNRKGTSISHSSRYLQIQITNI